MKITNTQKISHIKDLSACLRLWVKNNQNYTKKMIHYTQRKIKEYSLFLLHEHKSAANPSIGYKISESNLLR